MGYASYAYGECWRLENRGDGHGKWLKWKEIGESGEGVTSIKAIRTTAGNLILLCTLSPYHCGLCD